MGEEYTLKMGEKREVRENAEISLPGNEPLLSAKGVFKIFSGPAGDLEILRGVDFAMKKGGMCFILGRSGSGKTTLLNILATLDRPTRGEIFFREKNLTALGERDLARYRNGKVGFVFQFYYLLPELDILENVMLPGLMAKGRNLKSRAEALLEKLGLSDRIHHSPARLSGGELQRAAIARSLINDPEIVFCDEPTGNLDEKTAEQVLELIFGLNRVEKRSFCIVTHEKSMIRDFGTVYHLHEGRLERG
ncbi:MAG TPA: ABC transporter ATP-binding protein [Candidatus Omnitrophota bacterium]|nr:ABC transporter ATP-binding protein [Candidatus Omnitrophota bacterium]